MSTAAAPMVDQTVVLHPGIVDYQVAWQMQRDTLEGIVAGTTPNTLILLQHPSVYTAGRMTKLDERPLDGTPVIDVDRGGKITWHGLGQIVGYPIVKLKNRNDVVGFVREVETALIDVCLQFGIPAERYCERSGVWIRDEKGDRKIAAIGMRVAKGGEHHQLPFAKTLERRELKWRDELSGEGRPLSAENRDERVCGLNARAVLLFVGLQQALP